MVTSTVESLIRELAVGGRINLESVYLKAEERGLRRALMLDAVGRLASEGVIRIRKGVIEVVR